ncbi:9116_t:CDS:2 [Cetraspora pellucida]|uniref:9116_t:CDS:1 n=1 Tax=Cetraspora pellucida TaxID=1433469 RepID=A0A9N9HLT4_9GLOM|nr:9116_t:CDS:2 [Cetraspora pellucida]
MRVFDPTKPVYTGYENIEEFLVYFEAYAASKDWDDNKKSLVVILHIADRLKPSIMQLRKNNSSWKDLRTAMIKRWATSSDLNEGLERLKNMVQETGDTVQMYTSCFDAYVTEIQDQIHIEKGLLDMYEAAKELAVKMEKYDRDRKYINKNPVQITNNKKSKLVNGEATNFQLFRRSVASVINILQIQKDWIEWKQAL